MTLVPILCYHSISQQASERFQPWALHPQLFEKHMQLLAERGYVPMSVSQLLDTIADAGRTLPSQPLVLTFDDGFLDFHSEVLPILERYAFASTLYVTTGYLGGTAGWLATEGESDRAMMDWDHVRDAYGRGVDLGSHSHTHPKLDELPLDMARDEVVRSKEVLEDALSRPVRTFAYPHGYHGRRVRQLVVEAGYDGAAAVRHAISSTEDDIFGLARIIVYGGTPPHELDTLLKGNHLPQAPFPEQWRTTAWRLARRTRRSLAAVPRGGA